MKKAICFLLILFVSLTIRAQTEVTIYDNSTHSEIHNSEVPTVSSSDDGVIIKCDSTLTNVYVVIKDELDNIIHASTHNISTLGTIIGINPPKTGTIELYYKNNYLYGYFN